MKQPLILVLLLFLCTFSNAQEYAVGIKAGLNYYNIGDLNSRGGSIQAGKPDETFTPNNEIGNQFGAFLNVAFGNLYIRPEINFVSNKNNYDFPVKTSHWKASKMDFPILVGYKVFDPISIYIGPSFSFFSEMTIEGANNSTGASPINYDKTTSNLIFGIQVEFKRFGVDLRYEYGLKETEGESGDNYQDFHNSAFGTNITDIWPYKPSQISLSLNIFLFRTDGDDIDDFFSKLFRKNACDCLR
ncbi:MAG: PorT family protein [Flavobacteriaceae bacterium]|nr:PorT family protein [Flavobacteriaceae bacterium]